jgi:hypothetical protein
LRGQDKALREVLLEGKKVPVPYDGKQFSVRASILLWIVLAAALWAFVGVLVGSVIH